MIDLNELKIKLSIIDNTKKNLDKSKSNFKNFFKDSFSKDEKKKVDDYYKNIKKNQDKINQENKRSGGLKGLGDTTTNTLKSLNREDTALMEAIRNKGKELKSYKKIDPDRMTDKDRREIEGFNNSTKSISNNTSSKIDSINVNEIKVQKISGTGVEQQQYSSNYRQKKSSVSKIDNGIGDFDSGKTQNEGLKEGIKSGSLIPFVGIALAAAGAIYSVMSSRAEAFRGSANQQIGNIQSSGFGSNGPGGFYTGFQKAGYGLTGSQNAEIVGQYTKQTGYNQSKTLQNMDIDKLAKLQNAYGFNAGQLGNWTGNLQRFGKGKNGVDLLNQTMQTAQNAGMSGARSEEFINDMQEALTNAVMSGSKRSVDDINKSLGVLMKTSDERLKVLAPGMLQSAMQSTGQSAMLEGGAKESFIFQSVQAQMQKRNNGKEVSIESIQNQLNDNMQQTMLDVINQVESQFGKGTTSSAMMMHNIGLGFEKITDTRTIKEMMSNIKQGYATSGVNGTIEGETTGRLEQNKESLFYTQFQDVRESVNTLTDANRLCAESVNKFRQALEDSINGLYKTANSVLKFDQPKDSYSSNQK
jgi:hypothetical protein